MKRKKYIFSGLLIILISIVLTIVFINRQNSIKININKSGIYDVYFYNVDTKKKIDYGKKISFFGTIAINKNKLEKDTDDDYLIDNHYLIVVESKNEYGVGTFTFLNYHKETPIGKHINKIYEEEYKSSNLDIELIKKESKDEIKITNNYISYGFIKLLSKKEGLVIMNPGVYTLNSISNNQNIIGKQLFFETGKSGNSFEEEVDIYKRIGIRKIILSSNEEEEIIVEVPTYLSGLLSEPTHFDNIESVKYLELLDLQYYPLK